MKIVEKSGKQTENQRITIFWRKRSISEHNKIDFEHENSTPKHEKSILEQENGSPELPGASATTNNPENVPKTRKIRN